MKMIKKKKIVQTVMCNVKTAAKSKIIAFCVMTVCLLALSACAGGNSQGQGQEQVQDPQQDPVTLKVGMAGKDIKTVCVILANELGYYEEEGLNVEFEMVATLNDGVTALSMNKLDVLPYGFVPSATFISQGTDVRIIGGTISEGSQAIVKAENKDMIKTPADFKGKRIGFVRPETGQIIMKKIIRDAGLDISSDMEFIPMDGFPTIAEAVSKGELDIGFVNSNYGFVAQKMGLAIAFDVGDYAPDAVCCRQTASKDAVENKRDALVRFMAANLKAYAVYMNDHETTIKTLVSYSGQDEEYVDAAMYNGVMLPILDPSTNRIMEMYDAMKGNGDIDANTSYRIEDYVDASIYKDALDIMIEKYQDEPLFAKLLAEYETKN